MVRSCSSIAAWTKGDSEETETIEQLFNSPVKVTLTIHAAIGNKGRCLKFFVVAVKHDRPVHWLSCTRSQLCNSNVLLRGVKEHIFAVMVLRCFARAKILDGNDRSVIFVVSLRSFMEELMQPIRFYLSLLFVFFGQILLQANETNPSLLNGYLRGGSAWRTIPIRLPRRSTSTPSPEPKLSSLARYHDG